MSEMDVVEIPSRAKVERTFNSPESMRRFSRTWKHEQDLSEARLSYSTTEVTAGKSRNPISTISCPLAEMLKNSSDEKMANRNLGPILMEEAIRKRWAASFSGNRLIKSNVHPTAKILIATKSAFQS
jgi:hypothetical protein